MGRPVLHWEINARDAARLKSFYSALFDWKIDAANPLNYGLVNTGDEGGINGGIAPSQDGGVTFYVQVDDLDAYLSKAASLGGTVVMPATVVPGAVTLAMLADPEGNRIGLLLGRRSTRSEQSAPGGAPVIKELTPELLGDYLAFFDHDAFADNPAWADCYCLFYHLTQAESEESRTAVQNRAAIGELIGCGQAQGFLAYVDGKPAGWCNAAPRTAFRRLHGWEEARVEDADCVGSIVCFTIAAPYRRQGIARYLLEAACEGFRRRGLAFAEAYPVKHPTSDANAYHGPPEMYLAAGFSLYRDLGSTLMVRKPLRTESRVHPPVVDDTALAEEYREAARDSEAEQEATEWVEAIVDQALE